MKPDVPTRTTLYGHRLLAVKASWVAMTILIVGLSVAAMPVTFMQYLDVCDAGTECHALLQLAPQDVLALRELGLSVGFYAAYMLAANIVYILGFWVIGAVIFWRKSDDRMALLFSFMMVTFGAANIVEWDGEINPALGLLGMIVGSLGYVLFYVSFFLFPDGHFIPRWGIWPVAVWSVDQGSYSFLRDSSLLPPKAWLTLLHFTLVLGLLGIMVYAQIYRYLRVSGPVERQQTKWVVFGLATAIALALATAMPLAAFPALLEPGVPKVLYALTQATVVNFSLLLIPLSIAVAIFKYRLWDIDIIINRTIVYGTLTTSVVGIYVLLVGSLGTLLQTQGNFFVSLLAAGVVAVLFAPLRDRLQRGVNRLMYGERDDPYGVLSRLGKRLEATLAPRAVLPTIVETVAGALKLPYAAIAIRQGDEFKTAAAYGSPAEESTILPLVYQGETIGRLLLAPRAPGEVFTPVDRRLLEDLARNAEVAVHAVSLTADLQRSRERLVTAREEERRRLRRDLHDGVGPTLAGLTFGLDAVRSALSRQPEAAEALLVDLKSQTQAAVSDIRRLVYGLRPPALDDLGLVPAIRQQAENNGILADEMVEEPSRELGPIFSVEAPEQLPPLPAAVEVACYRITQEAMTNVSRHARARHCRVRLSVDETTDALEIEVTDDGVGLPEDRRSGVGLSSMRERTAELGGNCSVEASPAGGTVVLASLPLPDKEDG